MSQPRTFVRLALKFVEEAPALFEDFPDLRHQVAIHECAPSKVCTATRLEYSRCHQAGVKSALLIIMRLRTQQLLAVYLSREAVMIDGLKAVAEVQETLAIRDALRRDRKRIFEEFCRQAATFADSVSRGFRQNAG